MEQFEQLTDEQLRHELLAFNANIGPITDTTRNIYRLKLQSYISSAKIPSERSSTTDSLFTDEQTVSAESSDPQPFNSKDDFPNSRPSIYYNDVISQHQNRSNWNASAVPPPASSFIRNGARDPDEFGPSNGEVEAGGDIGYKRSYQTAVKPIPSKKVTDLRTSSQNDSPSSPNMTSTPHYGTSNASPVRNSVGTTPLSSGAAAMHGGSYTQTKLFGDVPTNYPQLRQRVQPSAGSTPATMTSSTSLKSTSTRTTARQTAAVAASYGNHNSSVAQSNKSPMFYVKFAVYCFLCFVILLAFLVWLNMEPAVSV